jgi:hypothetical protein
VVIPFRIAFKILTHPDPPSPDCKIGNPGKGGDEDLMCNQSLRKNPWYFPLSRMESAIQFKRGICRKTKDDEAFYGRSIFI